MFLGRFSSLIVGFLLSIMWVSFLSTQFSAPPHVYGQTDIPSPAEPTTNFLVTPVFTEETLPTITLSTVYKDSSTNIAFYMKCPSLSCPNEGTPENPIYIFSAENLGQGEQPFFEYWSPPEPNDYVAIEYKNDNQQFSCSSLTFDTCLTDPRFVRSYYFKITDPNTPVTPEMITAKAALNDNPAQATTTETATVSDALLLLSISLSSTSISSNLDNGLVVTATLDGIVNVATSTLFDSSSSNTPEASTSSEATTTDEERASIGSFILDIVEGVIDLFTPETEEPSQDEPSQDLPPGEDTPSSEPLTTEPILDEPPVIAPEPAPAEVPLPEVQSLSPDENAPYEITTTTF